MSRTFAHRPITTDYYTGSEWHEVSKRFRRTKADREFLKLARRRDRREDQRVMRRRDWDSAIFAHRKHDAYGLPSW